MVTLTPRLGLHSPEDPDDANDAVRVWRTQDNAILDEAVPGALAGATILTNPGLEVWQRGPGPFSGSLVYTADRWRTNLGGTSTIAVSRDGANVDTASQYCAACVYTHNADSSLQQLPEEYLQLRGRTLAFGVRVKTTVANAVRAALYDSVSLWRYGAYHTGDGAYQTLTVTAPIDPAATTMTIAVRLAASGTFYVDNAVLVIGAVAPPFAPLHPAEELMRCQRYYEVLGSGQAGEAFGVGQCLSASTLQFRLQYAPKAVVPTITVSAPSDFGVLNATGGAANAFTGLVATGVGTSQSGMAGSGSSGLVAGNAGFVQQLNTNARIRIEANPP